jgi:branched-chain amino acid transport system permease protein
VTIDIFTNNKKTTGLIALLIIMVLIPLFVSSPYYLDLIIIWMLNSVLAMTFLIMLRTGLISMAIAAFYGIGAYASAMLVTSLGWSFWISLPLAAIITMIFALIFALPLIRNTGFTFVILTTVIGMVFGVAVGNIDALGAYNGISNIPPPNPINIPFLPPITFESKISFFYLALFLSVICILIIKAFYTAWTGRAWTAIGLNQRLAESLGINVFRYKLIGFVLASGIAGLLGSYFAHYQSFVQPDTFNIFVTIYLQIYAILGGVGYAITGPIFGTAILTFIPEFLRITREYGTVFVGALVIILILFLPRGLLSLFEKESVLTWLKKMGEAIGLKSTNEPKRDTNDT